LTGLLGKIGIGERLTALIAIVCLAVRFGLKVSNPLMIGRQPSSGASPFPIIQPAWVSVQ
jgi:hypothetical protein